MTILIFDFDGVLIDSKNMYVKLINIAFEENKINISFNQIEKKLIPSIKGTIEKVIPKNSENKEFIIDKIENRVIELTSTKGLDYIKINKDAINVLKALKKNNKIFLLTNSHSLFTNKVLSSFKINHYFNKIITLDSGFSSKEKSIKYIAKSEQLNISNIYYIGDTIYDIKLSKKIGCKIVIVYNENSWDFQKKQEILELSPDFVINNLSDLIPIVQNEY